MLPFLKNQKEGSASSAVETVKRAPDQREDFGLMDSIAHDLMQGLEKKDAWLIKEALSALVAHIQDMDEEQDNQY